jgi:hypothetical protein
MKVIPFQRPSASLADEKPSPVAAGLDITGTETETSVVVPFPVAHEPQPQRDTESRKALLEMRIDFYLSSDSKVMNPWLANCHGELGQILMEEGRESQNAETLLLSAESHLLKALDLATDIGDLKARTEYMYDLSEVAALRGEPHLRDERAQDAVELADLYKSIESIPHTHRIRSDHPARPQPLSRDQERNLRKELAEHVGKIRALSDPAEESLHDIARERISRELYEEYMNAIENEGWIDDLCLHQIARTLSGGQEGGTHTSRAQAIILSYSSLPIVAKHIPTLGVKQESINRIEQTIGKYAYPHHQKNVE